MTAFEDLKSQWGNQSQPEIPEDGAKQVLEKITFIRKGQKVTNIVLALTGLVLIAFFFYVSAYKFQTVMIGLLCMIGALILRISAEVSSIRTLKKLNVAVTAEKFKQKMVGYYKGRTKVHFILTPIVILLYCIGFIMLLPAFKENLSLGFYNYILISSVVLLIVFSIFIAREAKKELALLKELKTV